VHADLVAMSHCPAGKLIKDWHLFSTKLHQSSGTPAGCLFVQTFTIEQTAYGGMRNTLLA
jgi:hypothetical protein